MDAGRAEIGRAAARIIVDRMAGTGNEGVVVEMTPKLDLGDTLGRKHVWPIPQE
jgi:hypothetical protein